MFYLRDVALFAFFLALIILASRAVWRRTSSLSRLEVWALVGGSTSGLGGLLVWIFGSTIGVGKSLVVCLILVPLACFFWARRTNTRVKRASLKNVWRDLAFDEKLLAFYTVVVCAVTFLLSLAPPNAGDYDSLVYHLAAPAQYTRAGRIVELSYDHHTYFPFTLEMLYLVGLLWSGPVLAKLFHWLMLPLACALLVGSSTRWATRRAGLAGAALWCSLPLVQLEASTAYIDLGLAFFTLGALYLFWRWRKERLESSTDRSVLWLTMCGAWCGFCLGTKYLGALTFGFLGFAILWTMFRTRRWQRKNFAAFAVVTLLISGGWYGRNVVWTGNPVFPFAYGVFGGEGWTSEKAASYQADQSSFGFGKSPIDLLWLPWRASFTPLNIGVTNDNRVLGQPFWPFLSGPVEGTQNGLFDSPGILLSSFIGPILLALGAPLLFAKRPAGWIRFLAWSALFFGLVWALTSQQLRFVLPGLLFLCAVCGWGVEQYAQRSRFLRVIVALAIASWCIFATAVVAFQARRTWPVVLGQVSPENYLSRTFAGYGAMSRVSRELPPNVRIAVYGEPRTFYIERDYFWADEPHNLLVKRPLQNGEEFVSEMRRLGATHILVNQEPARNGGFGGAPPQLAEAVAQGRIQPLWNERGYTLYVLL